MQRRVSASGRPSGTDGSDYSYQMVVDFSSEDLASRGLEIATTSGGLISLIIGALGRKRSRVNLLRFFMVMSSIVFSFLIYCAIRKYSGFMKVQKVQVTGK